MSTTGRLEQPVAHEADPVEMFDFAWAAPRPGFADTAHTLVAGTSRVLKIRAAEILAGRGITLHAVLPW